MKTVTQIYEEMLALFRQETNLEASAVSDLSVRFYAVAAQIYALLTQCDWLLRQVFPQTASGVYLERHAALRGLTRRAAVPAQGSIRFLIDTPASTDLTIPAGTICTSYDLIRFETLQTTVLKAGNTSVETAAQAVQPGASGNVPANTIRAMAVAPVGISRCINPDAFHGGIDTESDDLLRSRVLETYRRMPNGANAAFYEQGALSFDQVAAATVIPRSRGKGTVDVVVATPSGIPDAALLQRLTEYFELRREIAVDVQVKAPTIRRITLRVKVVPKEPAQADTVKTSVRTTLQAWFSGKLLSQDIRIAELYQLIFSLEGVENCTLLSPSSDIPINQGELPQLQSLSVEVSS